jgi:hypothetical protein
MTQIESAGEAVRDSARRSGSTVRPALSGCPECGLVEMIAAPTLGTCETCGSALSVLDADRILLQAGATGTAAFCELETAWG